MADNLLGDNPNKALHELDECIVTDSDELYQIFSSIDSLDDYDEVPALNIIGHLVERAPAREPKVY